MNTLADISLFNALMVGNLKDSPTLAHQIDDVSEAPYPAYVSEKLDGMRCLIDGEGLWSRTGKPQKPELNKYFQGLIDYCKENGVVLDGELYSEDAADFGDIIHSIKGTSSEEMSNRNLKFHCFDIVPETEFSDNKFTQPFHERYDIYQKLATVLGNEGFVPVLQTICKTPAEAKVLYDFVCEKKGEGIMLRQDTPYEKKRTKNLLKLKRWNTCDGMIVDIEPYCEDKENGIYRDYAGTVTVIPFEDQPLEPLKQKCSFDKNAGVELRKYFWDNRDKLIGKAVEWGYMSGGKRGRHNKIIKLRPDKDVEQTEQPPEAVSELAPTEENGNAVLNRRIENGRFASQMCSRCWQNGGQQVGNGQR